MVEIIVQILATSVPIANENLRYKLKTWWAHVDVGENVKTIKLPGLPMIEHYYKMNGKETTVFVEMWYRNPDLFPEGAMRFLGLAKHRVDDQLKNPACNPTVEWLEIYDPIEDIVRGRLLLKVDAKFVETTTIKAPPALVVNGVDNPNSSYFNRSSSSSRESGDNTTNRAQNNDDDNGSPAFSISSADTVKMKSVPVQTDFPLQVDSVITKTKDVELHSHPDKLSSNDALPINLDLEIAKAKRDLAVRERERSEKQQLMHNKLAIALSGNPSCILPEFGELSPIHTCTPPGRDVANKRKIWASEGRSTSSESDIDEVIQLLNRSRKLIDNHHHKSPENVNLQEPEELQMRFQFAAKPPPSHVAELGKRHEECSAEKLVSLDPDSHTIKRPINVTCKYDDKDLTIYGCGFKVKPANPNPRGPKTALKFQSIEAQRSAHVDHEAKEGNTETHTNTSSSKAVEFRPVSQKCAAKFSFSNN